MSYPDFLPPAIEKLIESTSITLVKQIQQVAIQTPLTPQPITTTYVQTGEGGTPILLIHGFDSSVLEFRRLLPLLAQNQETWAVDLLGFGFTDRIPKLEITPLAIKTHLYYFWKTLIEKPVILVGASMGGAAALDFALTYPQVVEKLVLIDSAGLSNPPRIGKLMFYPFDYLATAFLKNSWVRHNISWTAYFDKTLASIDANLCAALHLKCSNWSPSLISFTKSGGYGSFLPKLSQLKTPTLILWGENDQILGTKDAYRFQDNIPNSQLVWIPNCGHVPHLEKPDLTAQYIQSLS